MLESATHAKPIVKHSPRVSDSRVSGGRFTGQSTVLFVLYGINQNGQLTTWDD